MSRIAGTRILKVARSTSEGWMALWLCVFFMAGLSNCAQPISKDKMTRVNQGLTYSVVIENPKAYVGSTVRWGGVIEEIVFGSMETRIVVKEVPMDVKGSPQMDVIEGEFIVLTSQDLNPLGFKKGILITVAGDISGVDEKEIGATRFLLPVVLAFEVRPWGKRPLF